MNTDASVRLHPAAVKRLVAALADPGVGVASGNDISVARTDAAVNAGESRYVGYEMWVRALETGAAGIVGSPGCLYAIRARLHGASLEAGLSRDFASALISRLNGFRAVSVPDAICYVPRIQSVGGEYWRKVRTITRGLQTLWNHRTLMNPVRYGLFAVMTANRYEIEFQGSRDGTTWIPYPFRYKPQDVRERPGIYAPYQPRFEWNLWFSSLAPWQTSPCQRAIGRSACQRRRTRLPEPSRIAWRVSPCSFPAQFPPRKFSANRGPIRAHHSR